MNREVLTTLFAADDHDGLAALGRRHPGRVLRFVLGRLPAVTVDDRRRAARALGHLVRDPASPLGRQAEAEAHGGGRLADRAHCSQRGLAR